MSGMPDWYAIWTRSRHEQVVREQLEGKGIEAFLPTVDEMVQEGLVTLERAEVILYRGPHAPR